MVVVPVMVHRPQTNWPSLSTTSSVKRRSGKAFRTMATAQSCPQSCPRAVLGRRLPVPALSVCVVLGDVAALVRSHTGGLGIRPALDNGNVGEEPDGGIGGPVADGLLKAIVEKLSHGHRAFGADVDQQFVV